MPRGGQLRGERSSGCWKLGLVLLVSGESSSWMSAPRVREPKHRPRPSALEALVSSLNHLRIRGSVSRQGVWSVASACYSTVNERILNCAASPSPGDLVRGAVLGRTALSPCTALNPAWFLTWGVRIEIHLCVSSHFRHLESERWNWTSILGGIQSLRPLVHIGPEACHVNDNVELVGEEAQEVVPEHGPLRHIPLRPRRKFLTTSSHRARTRQRTGKDCGVSVRRASINPFQIPMYAGQCSVLCIGAH
jgi:hypothetical protein